MKNDIVDEKVRKDTGEYKFIVFTLLISLVVLSYLGSYTGNNGVNFLAGAVFAVLLEEFLCLIKKV